MRADSLLLLIVGLWLVGAMTLYSSGLYHAYYARAALDDGGDPQRDSVADGWPIPSPPPSRPPRPPPRREKLALCRWRLGMCAHLNRTASALNGWQLYQGTLRPTPQGALMSIDPAICAGESPVRLELRGQQFRSWWGHVMPEIAASAMRECPTPCEVRNPPFPRANVVVDTLAPGPVLDDPVRQKRAVVALENGGQRGGTHGTYNLARTDLLSTWLRSSDVPINYMYAWRNLCQDVDGDLERCMAPVAEGEPLHRKKLAAAFVSNCKATERTAFFRELMRHMPPGSVDSWGKCLHTQGLPNEQRHVEQLRSTRGQSSARPAPGSGADAQRGIRKIALLSTAYKFAFAFENSVRHDYVTEKALHPVLAGVVPVLWGAPDADAFMPGGPGSYINALDFSTPRALADYLVTLDGDDALYLRHFDWRTSRGGPGPTRAFRKLQRQSFVALGADSWPCRMCQAYRRLYCPAV